MSMIIPPAVVDAIPPRVRQAVYAGLALAFVVLTAMHAGYASLELPDPRGLAVAFAVYGVLSTAALTLATANSRPALPAAASVPIPDLELEGDAPAGSPEGPAGVAAATARRTRAKRRRPPIRTPEDG